jgi:hypothetical protein
MKKSYQQRGFGHRVAHPWVLFMGVILLILSGCAPTAYRSGAPSPASPQHFERPTGPGAIPPHWYHHDPALGQWFSPWYVNPYQ